MELVATCDPQKPPSFVSEADQSHLNRWIDDLKCQCKQKKVDSNALFDEKMSVFAASPAVSQLPVDVVQLVSQHFETIQIFIKVLNRPLFAIDAQISQSIAEIKKMIEFKVQIPADQMRILFRSRQLEDQKRLHDYDLYKEATLRVLLRLRGGSNVRKGA
jgi:hypothetical protein